MYSKNELTAMAHVRLMEIAEQMGISKAKRLEAQELVYKILDHQATHPEAVAEGGGRKARSGRRACRQQPRLPRLCLQQGEGPVRMSAQVSKTGTH